MRARFMSFTMTVLAAAGCKEKAPGGQLRATGTVVETTTPGALSTVELNGKGRCTGTLVRIDGKDFIVSAAHCAKPASAGPHQEGAADYTVGFPFNPVTGPDTPIEAVFIKRHEAYTAKPDANGTSTVFIKFDDNGDGQLDLTEGHVNDIALWFVKGALPGSYAPLEIAADAASTEGQELLALGAGTGKNLNADGTVKANSDPYEINAFSQLKLIVATAAPKSAYAGTDGAERLVFRSMAQKVGEAQAFLCRGDSGGPAFKVGEDGKATLYGIASFAPEKAKDGGGTTYDCERGVVFHGFAPGFRAWVEAAAKGCTVCEGGGTKTSGGTTTGGANTTGQATTGGGTTTGNGATTGGANTTGQVTTGGDPIYPSGESTSPFQ